VVRAAQAEAHIKVVLAVRVVALRFTLKAQGPRSFNFKIPVSSAVAGWVDLAAHTPKTLRTKTVTPAAAAVVVVALVMLPVLVALVEPASIMAMQVGKGI